MPALIVSLHCCSCVRQRSSYILSRSHVHMHAWPSLRKKMTVTEAQTFVRNLQGRIRPLGAAEQIVQMEGSPAGLLTQLGIMNKISTGNTFVDIVLCMLMPLLLAHFAPFFEQLKVWLTVRASNLPAASCMPFSVLVISAEPWPSTKPAYAQ